MNAFELNKIAGAILGALTVVVGVNVLAGGIFHDKKPEKAGYPVEVKEAAPAGGAPKGEDFNVLLAKADPAKGEQVSKKCGACHSFGKGEPAKMGPNLYGIVGLKHAHMEGFGYSDPMKKSGGEWDFASLDKWLTDPKAYIAGTTMAFAGIKNPEERANLVAYLNKNSDAPKPIPAAEAKAAEPAAAAGGAPAAGGFEAKVASADPAKGQQTSKKCAACHSFGKGEPAKLGPNLYGIVGLKHAHMEGFEYSEPMKKTGGVWDIASLDKWLTDPKAMVPGTTMAFAGIKNEDERAALIAWLNKNSDKPQELGGATPAAAPAGAPAAPAASAPAAPEQQAPKPANEQSGGGSEADKPGEPAPAPAAPAEPSPAPAAPAAPAEPAPAPAGPAPAAPAPGAEQPKQP
ncbi:c-type cytochrome [Hansschlegelia quercus]|uniref:Cytochrome c family protein n=1 Tax=Hansschlegelia quercus TaxID=2528245 RepID=A0A4Q9GCA7_9HYPH|nr:cytochrome c family protein [Hansschlegelia quercus]TBN47619.1 cytochrome c family protein [Hansschlegelia quercus]